MTPVRVFEVGPRDGLQNEPRSLGVGLRLEYVARLVAAGLRDVEVGSFVHPKWVPQMAGTDELMARLPRVDGVRYWAIVPNAKGLERALAAGATHLAFLLSASETHSAKNLNKSIAEASAEVEQLARAASGRGLAWRGYVSVAFGCPYEGAVDPDGVLRLASHMIELGAAEVSLGDTTGMGGPSDVRALARRAIDAFGADRVAFHFHDTRGLGVANALVVVEEGARTLDASAGGIGGCPYAPGAAGNVATEDVVHLLDTLGAPTGVDLAKLVEATAWLEREVGITPASRYFRFAAGNAGR